VAGLLKWGHGVVFLSIIFALLDERLYMALLPDGFGYGRPQNLVCYMANSAPTSSCICVSKGSFFNHNLSKVLTIPT
jgi:hypothetical protein